MVGDGEDVVGGGKDVVGDGWRWVKMGGGCRR